MRKNEGQTDQDSGTHTHHWGSSRHLLLLIKGLIKVRTCEGKGLTHFLVVKIALF